jgi:SAM-dependent methyltransferase
MAAEDLVREIHRGLEEGTPARLEHTRWAFESLSGLARPRVLDLGCGRGAPTLELARLGAGRVVGLDRDAVALAELTRRIAEKRLTGRVRLVRGSMCAMPFQDEAFDVVWAEGAVWVVGFDSALEAWRRHLVRGGFLVVHEMAWLQPEPPPEIAEYWRDRCPGIRTVPEYLAAVARHGYRPVVSRALPDDFWWRNYYRPLERKIRQLRPRYRDNPEALHVLDREQREVRLYERYRAWYGSAVLVMQKLDTEPSTSSRHQQVTARAETTD